MDHTVLANSLNKRLIKTLKNLGVADPKTKIEEIQQKEDHIFIKIKAIGDQLTWFGFYSQFPHETNFLIEYYDDSKIYVNVHQIVDKWLFLSQKEIRKYRKNQKELSKNVKSN